MSTTPAFSPGPCTTNFPRVGNRFKCTLLDLYEQCSLHITEKIPSSVIFGSRPRIFCMCVYSSFVTPCSAAISGVTLISMLAVAIIPLLECCSLALAFLAFLAAALQAGAFGFVLFLRRSLSRRDQRRHHRLEHHQPVRRIQLRLHRPLRMRPQASNIAFAIA